MTPSELRRIILEGLLSDDRLLNELVLKGGNALELVHGLIQRGSIDLDFSIAGEFQDLDDIQARIFNALRSRLAQMDLVLFDESLSVVPPLRHDDTMPWWGGYRVQFKLIPTRLYRELGGDLARLRIQALPVDPFQGRIFTIDISKHEYCGQKVERALGGHRIFVYSEEMCVIEKFRAICQQHPAYLNTASRAARPRARDFYDIATVTQKLGLDLRLPENLHLFRAIFSAKRVPLALLPRIDETREFHRSDWDSVVGVVSSRLDPFDSYFDVVAEQARRLETLWNE